MSNSDPTLTFDVERIKMEQDNLRNEMNYLRRQVIKLNIKIIENERINMGGRDRLRLRVLDSDNKIRS
jgi:hypothetical protein